MAINGYEMALEMDSLLTLTYSNLATAYSINGDNIKALETLSQLIFLEPEYGRGYYLRGLLNYEVGDSEKAIYDLEKSIFYDSLNFRAYYNLANLYLTAGILNRAEQTINAGLTLQPDSEEGQYLLKVIKSKAP
jgi:tetratricopeptide (TPR) repeat protein